MEIPSFYVENVGGPFTFDCDHDTSLVNLSNMPAFYIDILKAWTEVQRYARLICNKRTSEVVSCGITRILQSEGNQYIGRRGILLG